MATTDKDASEAPAESGPGRIKDALSKFASAQVQQLADKAGSKLTDLTGQLTNVSENGGSLPAIGSRVLKGESPVKAFVSEKAKGAKDAVVDKAKGVLGGGGGKSGGKAGGGKVTNIIEVLDVGVPLRTAYDAWTQYDEFSSFMKGVQSVSKSEDVESDWNVKVGPSSRSFKATVQEQVPDDRIIWTSEGAKGTTKGAVTFHSLADNLTRVLLVVEYYPTGLFEKTGNIWRAQGRRTRLDLKHFRRFVMMRGEETGSWRGEIRDGEVVRGPDEEERPEEDQAEDQTQDEDLAEGEAADEGEDYEEDEASEEEPDEGEEPEEEPTEEEEEPEEEPSGDGGTRRRQPAGAR